MYVLGEAFRTIVQHEMLRSRSAMLGAHVRYSRFLRECRSSVIVRYRCRDSSACKFAVYFKTQLDRLTSASEMTNRLPSQGNNFGLLLIGVPLLALTAVWFVGDLVLPIDQWAFVKIAAPICLVAYGIIWWLTFRRTTMSGSLVLTSVFLLLLWMMAGVPFVGWLNAWRDSSPDEVLERRVVSATQTRRTCDVRLDRSIGDAWVVLLKRRDCDSLRPTQDSVQITARAGRLGVMWMSDYAIVRGGISGAAPATPKTR